MGKRERLHVVQDLVVEVVHAIDTALHVSVRTARGRRERIVFEFADAGTSAAHAHTISEWARERRTLTYVRGGGRAALLDDEASFYAAMDPTPPDPGW